MIIELIIKSAKVLKLFFRNVSVELKFQTVKMFSRFQQPASLMVRGLSSSSTNNTAVAVMGAAGGVNMGVGSIDRRALPPLFFI